MAHDFIYGGNPGTIQIQSLTVGQSYTVSITGVGLEAPEGATSPFLRPTESSWMKTNTARATASAWPTPSPPRTPRRPSQPLSAKRRGNGGQNVQRACWNSLDSWMTSDIPSEARWRSINWGVLKLIRP